MSSQAMELSAPNALAEHLKTIKPHLERLVPDPPRFGVTLLAAARRTPQLLQCDPASLLGAALTCAQYGLEPGPADHVWLIPRRNKKTNTLDCTLLLGYRGMKALAERHPDIESVRTGTVYENDEFEHIAQPPAIRHVPNHADRGKAILWYAVATRTDGGSPHVAVLTREDVEARRKSSQSGDAGPWKTHYDRMAQKSCIRAIWSELPSDLDGRRITAADDGAVITTQDLGIPAPRTPRQLEAHATRIIDEATGEILAEAYLPVEDESGDEPAGEVQGEPVAEQVTPHVASSPQSGPEPDPRPAAQPETAPEVQSPEPASSAPPSATPSSPDASPPRAVSPAAKAAQARSEAAGGVRMATPKQLQMLVMLASEMGWDDDTRRHRAGVASFKELTFDKARELIEDWSLKVDDWRRQRQGRLVSAAAYFKISLEPLLQAAGVERVEDLTARQCQELIDEIEALDPSDASDASDAIDVEAILEPAEEFGDEANAELVLEGLRARFEQLLAKMQGRVRQARFLDTHYKRFGVTKLDAMSAEQLHELIAAIEKELAA